MAKAPSKRKASTKAKPAATKKVAAKKASTSKAKSKARLVQPEIVDHPEMESRLGEVRERRATASDQRSDHDGEEGLAEQAPTARYDEDELRREFDEIGDVEIDPDRDALDEIKPTPVKKAEVVDDSKALATSDPVAVYLAEIRRYALLTKEQEQELARRYRETGDPKAAEALVTSNLRFVVKVAAEYSRFGAKLIDLIQEGNVGLMHAVKEFNPYKGVRLITYAVWWIRGYIQEYLMRQYSLVRIGTTQNQRKLFYRLQKERDALTVMGQEPNVALLAGRLGVTEEEVETMSKRLSGRDVSLSAPVDGDNSTSTLLDFESSMDVGADEAIGHQEEMNVLKDNLEKIRPDLSEKETYILENRILADEPMTLQEIGEHYGVTREAVRQLEARLVNKIKIAVTRSLEGES